MIRSVLVSRIALVLGLAYALCDAPAAYALPSINPPFSAGVCLTPTDVTGALVGTGASY